MKLEKRHSGSLLFYILLVYVVLQFSWWAWLLVDLHHQVYEAGGAIESQEDLDSKVYMILGEGSVFIILLFVGFYFVQRSFVNEVRLADRQKNFLLSVTHELKSPLAGIRLNLQTLLKRELDRNRQEKMLGFALKETDRLNTLVDNILSSTRFENGVIKMYPETFNPAEEIAHYLDLHKPDIKHHVELTDHLKSEVFNDRHAFVSIFTNLLSNAMKYSSESSEIRITIEGSGQDVLLSVKDHGQGISPSEVPYVFDKFYRVGNEETRQSKGTGLGLYVVSFLSQSMGGRAKCVPQEEGTLFTVSFSKKLTAV